MDGNKDDPAVVENRGAIDEEIVDPESVDAKEEHPNRSIPATEEGWAGSSNEATGSEANRIWRNTATW